MSFPIVFRHGNRLIIARALVAIDKNGPIREMERIVELLEYAEFGIVMMHKLQPDGNGELYLDTMSATKLALKTFDLGVASVDATFESRIALLKSYANRLHRGLILADVQKKYLVDFLEALDGVLSQED